MLKKGSRSWLVWNIIRALLLFAGGLFTIIFSGNEGFRQTVIIILGAVILADAVLGTIFHLVIAIKSENPVVAKALLGQTFSSGMELASGIALLIIALNKNLMDAVVNFIGQYVGVIALVFAVIILVFTIAFGAAKKLEKGGMASNIISTVLLLAIGIALLIICNQSTGAMTLLFVVVGILLMALSVAIVVLSAIERKKNKQAKPKKKAEKKEKAKEEVKEEVKEIEVIDENKQDK